MKRISIYSNCMLHNYLGMHTFYFYKNSKIEFYIIIKSNIKYIIDNNLLLKIIIWCLWNFPYILVMIICNIR